MNVNNSAVQSSVKVAETESQTKKGREEVMRQFSALVFGLVLGGLMCFASPTLNAAVLFQDDFEGQTFGGSLVGRTPLVGEAGAGYYGSTASSITGDISTKPIPGATASGRFATANAPGNIFFTHLLGGVHSNEVISIEASIYVDSSFPNGLGLGMYGNHDGYALNSNAMDFKPDGTMGYDNGGAFVAFDGTLPLNKWMPLHVTMDYVAKTWTGSIDGTPITIAGNPTIPFTAYEVVNQIDKVYWASNNDASFVDNVLIYQGASQIVPEPSTLLLMLFGLFGLITRAKAK